MASYHAFGEVGQPAAAWLLGRAGGRCVAPAWPERRRAGPARRGVWWLAGAGFAAICCAAAAAARHSAAAGAPAAAAAARAASPELRSGAFAGTWTQAALWAGLAGVGLPALWFWRLSLHHVSARTSPGFELEEDGKAVDILAFAASAMSALCYLTLACSQGVPMLPWGTELPYALRHIDWAVTTPLMLAVLCCIAESSLGSVAYLMSAAFLTAVAWALGNAEAGDPGPAKWVFWSLAFALWAASLHEVFSGLGLMRRGRTAKILAWLTVIAWSLHLVVWGLGQEMAGKVDISTEAWLYAAVDIMAKSICGLLATGETERQMYNAES